MASPRANALPNLFLVRHGDTDWTDSHQHTGRTDIALNASGEARARRLGAMLRGERFTRVFASPLSRARRTCELAGFGGRAEPDPDLMEWDYGDFEGRTTAEIRRARPGWNLFRDGPPGGESPEQVAARVDRFVDAVRRVNGDVVAFSHGHLIRMVAARWLGLAPSQAGSFYAATASVGTLSYDHDLTEPVIRLWNYVQPLGETH